MPILIQNVTTSYWILLWLYKSALLCLWEKNTIFKSTLLSEVDGSVSYCLGSGEENREYSLTVYETYYFFVGTILFPES